MMGKKYIIFQKFKFNNYDEDEPEPGRVFRMTKAKRTLNLSVWTSLVADLIGETRVTGEKFANCQKRKDVSAKIQN